MRIMLAAALALLSLFMLIGFLRSTAALSSGATMAALLITVGLPAVGAVALIARHRRSGRRLDSRRDQLRQQTLESEVLRLAAQRDGRLTVVEIVTEMAVTTEHAQAALDALVAREVADIAISDSGVLVYTFHDIQHLPEKSRARGVLE
jgi:predicted DNA repair protein MutK